MSFCILGVRFCKCNTISISRIRHCSRLWTTKLRYAEGTIEIQLVISASYAVLVAISLYGKTYYICHAEAGSSVTSRSGLHGSSKRHLLVPKSLVPAKPPYGATLLSRKPIPWLLQTELLQPLAKRNWRRCISPMVVAIVFWAYLRFEYGSPASEHTIRQRRWRE